MDAARLNGRRIYLGVDPETFSSLAVFAITTGSARGAVVAVYWARDPENKPGSVVRQVFAIAQIGWVQEDGTFRDIVEVRAHEESARTFIEATTAAEVAA